ncbi:hypothetical protein GT347_01430 [Xylophilus rhododendri]|uniref:Uncharacterized protein n=1 Tax=Xylophilus rhododendri TaxID=2697032 RepID=A0A857IZM5_9BURK|nr:hypothetical protein [Xylophilus rhododendri]QHI96767.1 hypothetical protein GT347_01430 [Xylophilus rhododendri]
MSALGFLWSVFVFSSSLVFRVELGLRAPDRGNFLSIERKSPKKNSMREREIFFGPLLRSAWGGNRFWEALPGDDLALLDIGATLPVQPELAADCRLSINRHAQISGVFGIAVLAVPLQGSGPTTG